MVRTSPPSNRAPYVAVHGSAQFDDLRRRWRSFVVGASVVFTGWWFLAILLGAFAPDLYRQEVAGSLNVGLLFALATFALVAAITAIHLSVADSRLDPLGERVRAELEGDPR